MTLRRQLRPKVSNRQLIVERILGVKYVVPRTRSFEITSQLLRATVARSRGQAREQDIRQVRPLNLDGLCRDINCCVFSNDGEDWAIWEIHARQ